MDLATMDDPSGGGAAAADGDSGGALAAQVALLREQLASERRAALARQAALEAALAAADERNAALERRLEARGEQQELDWALERSELLDQLAALRRTGPMEQPSGAPSTISLQAQLRDSLDEADTLRGLLVLNDLDARLGSTSTSTSTSLGTGISGSGSGSGDKAARGAFGKGLVGLLEQVKRLRQEHLLLRAEALCLGHNGVEAVRWLAREVAAVSQAQGGGR